MALPDSGLRGDPVLPHGQIDGTRDPQSVIEQADKYLAQFADGRGNNQPEAEDLIRDLVARLKRPHSLPVSTVQALIDEIRGVSYEVSHGIRHCTPEELDEWADQLAAILASPSLPHAQWQPIETAPKDGTWFLAFVDGAMFVVHWDSDTQCRPGSATWRDAEYFPFSPTHWMVLPASPSLHRQEQEEDVSRVDREC